jgi:hypothetical protein
MSANPVLRVLAIDPGLAHCGLALVDVTGMHQLELVETRSLKTESGDPLVARLQALADAIGDVITKAQRNNQWIAGVVLEDPTEQVQRSAIGIRKDPRNIYKLCAAYGAIAAAVAHWISQDRITDVSVARWYPRNGRHLMRHDVVLDRIRLRHPTLAIESEHVCFAVGIADWWSGHVAPLVWAQRRRAAGFQA